MTIRDYLAKYPTLKRFVHRLLIPRGLARPRRWVSWLLNPFVHQHHPSAAIRATVRLDVLPFNRFDLGAHSLIEDFSVINNGVGDVVIGANTHLGIGAVIIAQSALVPTSSWPNMWCYRG